MNERNDENEQRRIHKKYEQDNSKESGYWMAEKNTKTETNKYAELRRTQYEIDEVTVDGKTFTVINAFPTDTDVNVEDRLRYLVKVS